MEENLLKVLKCVNKYRFCGFFAIFDCFTKLPFSMFLFTKIACNKQKSLALASRGAGADSTPGKEDVIKGGSNLPFSSSPSPSMTCPIHITGWWLFLSSVNSLPLESQTQREMASVCGSGVG